MVGTIIYCNDYKLLKGIGMYTYIGIIGYCLKDQGEEHFQFCHRNVNYE